MSVPRTACCWKLLTAGEHARERKLDRYFGAFEAGELSAALCNELVRGHRERVVVLAAHALKPQH